MDDFVESAVGDQRLDFLRRFYRSSAVRLAPPSTTSSTRWICTSFRLLRLWLAACATICPTSLIDGKTRGDHDRQVARLPWSAPARLASALLWGRAVDVIQRDRRHSLLLERLELAARSSHRRDGTKPTSPNDRASRRRLSAFAKANRPSHKDVVDFFADPPSTFSPVHETSTAITAHRNASPSRFRLDAPFSIGASRRAPLPERARIGMIERRDSNGAWRPSTPGALVRADGAC